MIIGITSPWICIIKWVYTCPPDAFCNPGFIDPNNGFLQDIRTFIQYWLYVGMHVFGVGLVKIVAYQSWSAMRQRGNTIDILDLNIGALKGSAYDAATLLLLRERNRSLGVFVLTHLAIIAAISLVVGKSITTVTGKGSTALMFHSPSGINILNVNPNHQSSLELGGTMYSATWNWFTNGAINSTFHDSTFSGTFVIQDGRTGSGFNVRPSGQQISGSISCVDPSSNISVTPIVADDSFLNITFGNSPLLPLYIGDLATGKLIGQQLHTSEPVIPNITLVWFTSSDGIIPNAMKVPLLTVDIEVFNNLSLFVGLCEHSITFFNLSQNDAEDGIQYIDPATPFIIPSLDMDPTLWQICDEICMGTAVWNTLLQWWSLQMFVRGTIQIDVYCYGGVLAPGGLVPGGDANQTCLSLDGEIWNKTLALALDAIIQTYPTVGGESIFLFAQQELIGWRRWWLQGIIPLSALILYFACLVYTTIVYSAGDSTMKRLDLLEVVNATRAHAEEGILTNSVMVGGKSEEQVGQAAQVI